MSTVEDTIAKNIEPLAWAAVGTGDTLAQKNRRISSERKAKRIIAAIASAGYAIVPLSDYARLVEASECDDTLIRCESCSAWIDHNDPALCTGEDYSCCWKVATGKGECRHERGELLELAKSAAKASP